MIAVVMTLLTSTAPLWAQVCGVPGKDGGVLAPAVLTGVVNTYYPSLASAAAGATLISVGPASPGGATAVGAGDLLLVIQMQGAEINSTNTAAYGDGNLGTLPRGHLAGRRTAGLHEFVVATGPLQPLGCPGGATSCVPIVGAGGGGGLIQGYSHRNTPSWDRFQVVRVPQYLSATLTSGLTVPSWNGAFGGVLAVDVASTVDLNGATVNLSGRGFRGGAGRSLSGGTPGFSNADVVRPSTVLYHASKGEGTAGTPRFVYNGLVSTDLGADAYPGGGFARGAPASAGGGGTDWVSSNGHNSGGGGGANGGDGGRGGFSWSSAQNVGGLGGVGTVGLLGDRLFLGGGGGAGSSNNAGPAHGGVGGGIVHIRADRFINAGTWQVSGTKPPLSTQDGAGGGGAGGTASIASCSSQIGSHTVIANGGGGGDVNWNPGDFHGPGGGGGGGVVLSSTPLASTSVAGGASGISPNANPFGALPGTAGDVGSAISAVGPGASPGCVCQATTALISDVEAGYAEGIPYVAWRTSSESGASSFRVLRLEGEERVPVHREVIPVPLDRPGLQRYQVADPGASADGSNDYVILEASPSGRETIHGPYATRLSAAKDARGEATTRQAWPMAEADEGRPRLDPRPAASKGVIGGASPSVSRGPAASLRLGVRETGWYQLSPTQIADGLDVPVSRVEGWLRQGRLRLESRGKPVAWTRHPANGHFLFFGQGPSELPRPWTHIVPTHVYRLRRGVGLPMDELPPPSLGRPVAPEEYRDRVIFEEQLFPATTASVDPVGDFWYWRGAAAATAHDTATVDFDIPGWLPAPSTLTVRLVGANKTGLAVDHLAEIVLNGQRLGEMAWGGLTAESATFEVGSSQLSAADNQLQIRALLPPQVEQNFFYLDGFDVEVSRQRRLQAATPGLRMMVTDTTKDIEVDFLEAPGALVFETTRGHRPRRLGAVEKPTKHGFATRFRAADPGVYWVVPQALLRTPEIEGWSDTPWRQAVADRRADLLILAPTALRSVADLWADYRRGDGLEVKVLAMEQVYDQFSHGMATPRAVRRLLRQAQGWQLAPRFVLLLGDGHFDYRDIWQVGGNHLPPPLTATADGLFASDRDLLPTSGPVPFLGRVPATDEVQALAAFAKMRAFEAGDVHWGHALLVADDTDRGGDFAADNGALAHGLGKPWTAEQLALGPQSLDTVRQGLVDALADGVGWVHFVGHGGIDRLAAEGILTSADLPSLPVASAGPLLTALTCNVGRFEFPGFPSLAGELVTAPEGGAVAVYAPSGLAYHRQAEVLGRLVAEGLTSATRDGTTRRLGDVLQRAQETFLAQGGDADYLALLHLFGDPAMGLPQ